VAVDDAGEGFPSATGIRAPRAGESGPKANCTVPLSQSDLAAADELDLANQARQGDHGAFTELVNRYARKVFRLARHITQNDQDAEDVLQDTFLKAYSRLDQFQGNSKFYTWLMRIGVNEALMRLRRRKGNQTVSLDDDLETGDGSIPREIPSEGSDPEENYGREELRESLDRAIDSLSESYRAVFLLRDVEGFSTEETAQMLGLSVSAVKSRLLRARLQLRGKLGRRIGQDGRQT
jgi:RNA polymerase sigma-70 factor (ECF subfamily)